MSKYKGHTPGPWVYDDYVVWGPDPYAPDSSITTDIADVYEYRGNELRCEANGRLIADAPKLLTQRDRLLEVLQMLDDGLSKNAWQIERGDNAHNAIKAAIKECKE